MGSIIDEYGGSDADVKVLIGKARATYLQLKNICNSKELSEFQNSSTVWVGNLENYENYHPEDTSVY
ncbi:unnamed protein product [Schistosoma curassoni]|uniref:Transcriptional regulator n=1 Tax=Schistosoma curassoni TaxID=6186 RepID=A0A183KZS0_9TREM|nr:unnamed protein product [Schistosoma curassoni]